MNLFQTFAYNPHGPHNDSIDDDNFVLCEDWDYIYEEDGVYRKMHFKEGIIYDSASVPNILGWIIDIHPNGVLKPAALPHDMLFVFQGDLPRGMQFVWDEEKGQWVHDDKKWKLKPSDLLFRRINDEYGKMSGRKQWFVYRVLKLGSWKPWRSKDHDSRKQIRELYE